MEFKVGQKYEIVDASAWWDDEAYLIDGINFVYNKFA